MFRTVPLSISPSSGVFHRTHSNGICHTGLLTTCEQDRDQDPDPDGICHTVFLTACEQDQDQDPDDICHTGLLTACEQDQDPDDICHTCLLTACEQEQCQGQDQDQDRHPDPARKLSTNLYDIYHCCVYGEKLLVMDRGTVRNM